MVVALFYRCFLDRKPPSNGGGDRGRVGVGRRTIGVKVQSGQKIHTHQRTNVGRWTLDTEPARIPVISYQLRDFEATGRKTLVGQTLYTWL